MAVQYDKSMDSQGLLVLIVGAGVAGLQTARALMKRGFQVVILEQCEDVGGVWIRNYQGYGLQVPWEHYQFPEFPYPRSSELADYPSGEAVRQYVQAYARHFDLYRHTLLSSRLVSLRRRQCLDDSKGRAGGGGGRGGGGSARVGGGSSCGSAGSRGTAAARLGQPAADADGRYLGAAAATRTPGGGVQEGSVPGAPSPQQQPQQPMGVGNERHNGAEKHQLPHQQQQQHHHHQQSDQGTHVAVTAQQEAGSSGGSRKGTRGRGGWVASCLSGLWGQARRYLVPDAAAGVTGDAEPGAPEQGQVRAQTCASAAGALSTSGCVAFGGGSSGVVVGGGCLMLAERQRRGSTTGELQRTFGAVQPAADCTTTTTGSGGIYDTPIAASGKSTAATQLPQPPPRTLLLTTGGTGGGGVVVLGGGDGFTSRSSTSFSQDVIVTGGQGVPKLEKISSPPLHPPQVLQSQMVIQSEMAKAVTCDQSTTRTTPSSPPSLPLAAQAAAVMTSGSERPPPPPPQQLDSAAAVQLPERRQRRDGNGTRAATEGGTQPLKGCSRQQSPDGLEAKQQQQGRSSGMGAGKQQPYGHHLPGGWEAVYEDMSTGRQYTLEVNFVVLCTGLYATPFIPTIAGQELYRGLQVHSRDFTDATVAAGKRVLVVGGGKTALDIVTELTTTRTAAEVTLLYRRPHWPLPRHVGPVSLKSLAYTRLMAAVLLPPYYNAPAPTRIASALLTPVRKAFWIRFMARVNASLGIKRTLGKPKQPICQDIWYSGQVLDAARWPEVVHSPQVKTLQGEVARFTPVSAVLQNGTELQPDIVLYATGYSNHYTFLEPALHSALQLQPDGLYLYRHCLAPDVPGLAFVGAEVSTFNNILTVALQAEWLAAVLAGDVALPPPAAMAEDVAAQQTWRRRIMPPHKLRGGAVMLYMLRYHDQLLRDLGASTRRKHRSWRHPLAEYLEPYTAVDYADVFKRTSTTSTTTAASTTATVPTTTAATTARSKHRSPQQTRQQHLQQQHQHQHTLIVEGRKSAAGVKPGHEDTEANENDDACMDRGSGGDGNGCAAAAGGVQLQPALSAVVTSAAAAAAAAEEARGGGFCGERVSLGEGRGVGGAGQRISTSLSQTPMLEAAVLGSRDVEAAGSGVTPTRALKPAGGAAAGLSSGAGSVTTTATSATATAPTAAYRPPRERSGGGPWGVSGSMCPSGPPYRHPPHVLPSGLGGFSSTGPERGVKGSFPGSPGGTATGEGAGTQCDRVLGGAITATGAAAAAAEGAAEVLSEDSPRSLLDNVTKSTAVMPARVVAGAGAWAGAAGAGMAAVGAATAAVAASSRPEPSGLTWRDSVAGPLYDVTPPSAAGMAAAMASKDLVSGAEHSEAFLDEQDTLYSLDALPPALQAFRRTRVRAPAVPPSVEEGSWSVVGSSVYGRGSTASVAAAMTMTQLLAAAVASRCSPAVSGTAQRCGMRAAAPPHAFDSGSGVGVGGGRAALDPSPFLTCATPYMLTAMGHASGPLPPRLGSAAANARDTSHSTVSISPTSLQPTLRPFSNPFMWASGGGGVNWRARSGGAPIKSTGADAGAAAALGTIGTTQFALQQSTRGGSSLAPSAAASLAPAVVQRLTSVNVSAAEVVVECSSGSSSMGGDSTDGDSPQQRRRRRRQRGLRRGFSIATLLMRQRTNNAIHQDMTSSRMEPSSAAVSELAYRVLPPRHIEEALAAAAAAVAAAATAATLKPRATGDGVYSHTPPSPPPPRISAATTTAAATAAGRCAAYGTGAHARTIPPIAAPALRTATSPLWPHNVSRLSVESLRTPSATAVGSSFVGDALLAPPPSLQRLKSAAPPAAALDGDALPASVIASSGVSYVPSGNTSPSPQHWNAAAADGRTLYQIATSYQRPSYNPHGAGVSAAMANGVANGAVGGPALWGSPTVGFAMTPFPPPPPAPQHQQRPQGGRVAPPPHRSASGSKPYSIASSSSSSSGESYLPTCSTVIAQPVMQAAQHWL